MALMCSCIRSQAEEDDVPLSQVFRLGSSPPAQPGNEKDSIEEPGLTNARPDVEKLLRRLEERVAAMETSMQNAVGGISNILSFMHDIKSAFPAEAAPKTDGAMHASPLAGVEPGTSNPPSMHLHGRIGTTARGKAVAGSRTGSVRESPPHTNVPRGTSSSNPVVVQEDESSRSAEHERVSDLDIGIQGGPASRVHSNPRMRPVPFQGKFGVSPASTSKDQAPSGPAGTPTSRKTKYRDPPGYDNVEDFGRSSDTEIHLPVLRPKNNSVSARNPFPAIVYFHAALLCSSTLTMHVMGTEPCEAWDALLGFAPRVRWRDCG